MNDHAFHYWNAAVFEFTHPAVVTFFADHLGGGIKVAVPPSRNRSVGPPAANWITFPSDGLTNPIAPEMLPLRFASWPQNMQYLGTAQFYQVWLAKYIIAPTNAQRTGCKPVLRRRDVGYTKSAARNGCATILSQRHLARHRARRIQREMRAIPNATNKPGCRGEAYQLHTNGVKMIAKKER